MLRLLEVVTESPVRKLTKIKDRLKPRAAVHFWSEVSDDDEPRTEVPVLAGCDVRFGT